MNFLNELKILTLTAWLFLPIFILTVTIYANINVEPPEVVPSLQVEDTPLLTPEQREAVLRNDSVAFKNGNELVVITHGAREALRGYY